MQDRWMLPDFYLTLEDEGADAAKWSECSRCKEKPRLWIYDNGSHAGCKCSGPYEGSRAHSESIGSVVRRTGGSCIEYSMDNLRINWNHFVETGEQLPYKNVWKEVTK